MELDIRRKRKVQTIHSRNGKQENGVRVPSTVR